MLPELILQRQGGVVILTLNRPERLNACNWELLAGLDQTLAELNQDAAARCLVVTGAGERAFSAGADLRALAELTAETARQWIRLGHRLGNRLATLAQPVVAALRGHVLGGGLELAMACDFRLAAADARLGLPEVSRGWLPGWGGLRRLLALVGPGRARQLALLGEQLESAAALSWGLVHRVVPADALMPETLTLAQRLAQVGPEVMGRAKAMLAPGLVIAEEAIEQDAEFFALAVSQPGFHQEIEAFLQRRKKGQ